MRAHCCKRDVPYFELLSCFQWRWTSANRVMSQRLSEGTRRSSFCMTEANNGVSRAQSAGTTSHTVAAMQHGVLKNNVSFQKDTGPEVFASQCTPQLRKLAKHIQNHTENALRGVLKIRNWRCELRPFFRVQRLSQ